jgi:chromosomal replication initiator protein
MQMPAIGVLLPENRAAWCAVERVLDCVCGRATRRAVNPLFLHGPAGTGKTHLVNVLLAEATRRRPDLTAAVLSAGEVRGLFRSEVSPQDLEAARQAELLVVEDLQHLVEQAVEGFVRLVDRCLAGQRQLVCTALHGPAQLTGLPARLTSRLAQGVVVGLAPPGPISRLTYLRERLRQRSPTLPVSTETLAWLAEHVSGSLRGLEGALTRLDTLVRIQGQAPNVDEVAALFQVDAEARRPTVERITQRVGHYFQVEPRQLRSRRRSRDALLPRQVGMYLARQLTELSLQQIGAYFGGRDHTTVLHACRKVEQALAHDIALSGAVRQLHADLS